MTAAGLWLGWTVPGRNCEWDSLDAKHTAVVPGPFRAAVHAPIEAEDDWFRVFESVVRRTTCGLGPR